MRLYTCHIENFGKLQDLDLDFRGGLHTIREENGWGKSTLAAFLLVMFYGFANEKSRSALTSERRRYAPWQQGVYGGSVTFSWKGQVLRLERVFGQKNAAEDAMVLYDAETNLPVEGFPGEPGETVFAIDRESFARTVFIAQQDCATEATSGIQAKIGHLEGEDADLADYHQVQASLKKMTDKLTPDRKTGEIYRIRQELAELGDAVSRRGVYENTVQRLEEQLEKRTEEMQRLRRDTEKRQEELRHLAVIQSTAENFSLGAEEQLRLQQLDEVFASGVPEEQQMDEAETCLREIRKMRASLDKDQSELVDPNEGREKTRTDRNGSSPAAILVFVLIISALLSFFMNKYLGIALLAAAIVIIIVVMRKDKKRDIEEGVDTHVIVINKAQTPFDRITVQREKREELQRRRREIREAEGELLEFLRQYYPDMTEEEDLSGKLRQLQYEKREYQSLLRQQEKSAAAEKAWRESVRQAQIALDAERAEGGAIASVADLEQIISENRKDLDIAEKEAASIRRQIESAREELDRADEAEEELGAMQEQLSAAQHRYDVLSLTREYLARARTAFTARYMDPVQRAFDRYYRMLTGSSAKEYQLDADLKIAVREYGLLREPEFLSEGWQDMIGLCRRMAMIDTMYEEEKPFLLFDDPFVNLDGEKLQRALEFLSRISETYQVIYFTCHESRVP